MSHRTPAIPSRAELVGRARELLPTIRARASTTEKLRRLPDETMRELFDAGFLRVCQPARYGGYEMPWGAHMAIAQELAQGCASTAWIVSVVGMHAVIPGRMQKRVQDEVWGDTQDVLISTGSPPTTGNIRRVRDGYQVSGGWRFTSGVDHAAWISVTAPVQAEDGAMLPVHRVMLRRQEIEIVDTWFVSGMSGTGSKDINVPEIVIPDWRVDESARNFGKSPPGAAINPEAYIFDVELAPYFGLSIFAPMVGAAMGALAEYVAITRDRKGVHFGTDVRTLSPVQQRVAESAMEIKVADMLLANALALIDERGAARAGVTPPELAEIGLQRAYVAKLCVDAVTRLVRQMGASGLSDDNPVQRHYRDIMAMSAQIGANWDVHAGQYGRHLFGLPLQYKKGSVTPQRV